MIARRSLLLDLGSLVASPAIIRVAPLMRIKPMPASVIDPRFDPYTSFFTFVDAEIWAEYKREYQHQLLVYGQAITGVRGDGTPYVVPFDEWAIA